MFHSKSPSPASARRASAFVPSLALALFASTLPAQEEPAPTDATDLPAVLKSISELEKLLTDGVSSNNTRALRALQEAAASPKAATEFYLEAKKAVDFDETGRSDADWRTWRDANEAENREPMNGAARQLQLRYIILCLQATSGPADREETMKKVLPLLVPYLDDLAERFPKLESGQDIVTGSALDSVFARHLKLDLTLDRKAGWPSSGGDVSGIYERIILPHFREGRDAKLLLAAWDKRIAHEAAVLRNPRPGGGGGGLDGLDLNRLRRGGGRDVERAIDKEESRLEDEVQETFRDVRLPDLQWQKERDGLLFGADRAAAYAKLTQHLRAHLDHPSAQGWLEELKSLAGGTYGKKPEAGKDG